MMITPIIVSIVMNMTFKYEECMSKQFVQFYNAEMITTYRDGKEKVINKEVAVATGKACVRM